ncbi:MAG: HAMP domain-containing sensor histidine kinase [bacterium]
MSFPRHAALRWTTLLLIASVGLTTMGVVEASRSVRSQRAVAEHALRDYAGFAAWSYQQHLRATLALATEELLGAVNHGHEVHRNPHIPPASDLPHYVPTERACNCHVPRFGPTPDAFLAFELGSDTLGVALNAHPEPRKGWEVDRPVPDAMVAYGARRYPPAVREWINDTLTRHIHAGGDVGRFPLVVVPTDSGTRVFAYTIMPTSWHDTLVYAVEYDSTAFDQILQSAIGEQDLLPATFTRGRPVRALVQLQVSDARGHTLFETDTVRRWALDDTASLGTRFGAMHVRAQIRPAVAGTLVIGGLPRSRLPFLLALLVIAAALSFVAIQQIRREGELARLRADFVASISHELRTPLAQMRLYLETLRLGRFTTDAQRIWSLDNVERETTRLGHLVERVLRFSRATRADADPRQPVDVATELERIVAEFQPLADARGARISAELDDVPRVALQADALRHIALNLLDNAVKYGPRGQTVHVRLRREGRDVRLDIADEGPGIADTERERIWQPYQRGGSAGHTAGSGIGLSIVHDLVALHGGRAWVESTPPGAHGARVVVTLPALSDELQAERASVHADSVHEESPDAEPVRS